MTAVALNWHDAEQTVLLCELHGQFGVESYAVMEGQLPMQVREQPHRVDCIVKLMPGATLPEGLLREIGILTRVMPRNFGMFVGVGNTFLLTNPLSVAVGQLFVSACFRQLGDRVRVADSVAAAVKLIATDRS